MPYIKLKTDDGHKIEIPSDNPNEKHYLIMDIYSQVFENDAFVFSGKIEVRNATSNALMYNKYDKWIGDKNIYICIDPNHPLYNRNLNVRGETLFNIINKLNPPPSKPRDLLEDEVPDTQWLADKDTYDNFVQWEDLPFDYTTQYDYIYSHFMTYVRPMFVDFFNK